MSNWMFALGSMLVYLAFAFVLGLHAGRKRSFWSVSEYAVAERGLGLIVIWFMIGGTEGTSDPVIRGSRLPRKIQLGKRLRYKAHGAAP